MQLVSFEKIVEEAEGKHNKKEKDQRENRKNKMEMTIKVFQHRGDDGCRIKAVPSLKEERKSMMFKIGIASLWSKMEGQFIKDVDLDRVSNLKDIMFHPEKRF